MRAFFAIELPEPARRAAVTVRDGLGLDGASWRMARLETLHLTLRFLGEVDPALTGAFVAAARDASRGAAPLPLALSGAGVFPSAARPRVVWIGVEDRSGDGALARLVLRLDGALAALGMPREERAWFPHVTLARAVPRVRTSRPRISDVGTVASFEAREIVLFRSDPSGAGMRHTPVGSAVLAR